MRRRSTALRAATATSIVLVFFGANVAHADLWGADIPLLSSILGNGISTLNAINDQVATLRKSYEEARRLAGYADDAYRTFKHFRDYTADMFNADAAAALDAAFPELSRLRREASGTGPWAEGTGELQRTFVRCLKGGATGCAELQDALTAKDARGALDAAFGASRTLEERAMDHEAAVGIAASHAQTQRNSVRRARAQLLLEACAGEGASTESIAACQAAASVAEIEQLHQSAAMSDQLAESNRLEAIQVAQENARRKRELRERERRRQLMLEGARFAAPPRVHL